MLATTDITITLFHFLRQKKNGGFTIEFCFSIFRFYLRQFYDLQYRIMITTMFALS